MRIAIVAALAAGCGGVVAQGPPTCELADASDDVLSVDVGSSADGGAKDAPGAALDAPDVGVSAVLLPPIDPPEPPAPAACGPAPNPPGACGSGTCVAAARTNYPHTTPLAVKLADGRAFVLGGNGYARIAEIYDPKCDRWALASPAPYAHDEDLTIGPIGGLLPDGRVLASGTVVTGSVVNGALQIYDPPTDAWTSTQVIEGFPISGIVFLHDGRVVLTSETRLLVGTPYAKTWTELSPDFRTTLRVSVVGLTDDRLLALAAGRVFVSDTTFTAWKEVAPLPVSGPRAGQGSVQRLDDGRVLVAGLGAFALYDVAADRWTKVPYVDTDFGSVTPLTCGKVLIIGDYDATPGPDTRALLDLGSDTVTTWKDPLRRIQDAAVRLDDGRVLIVGGFGHAEPWLGTEVCR